MSREDNNGLSERIDHLDAVQERIVGFLEKIVDLIGSESDGQREVTASLIDLVEKMSGAVTQNGKKLTDFTRKQSKATSDLSKGVTQNARKLQDIVESLEEIKRVVDQNSLILEDGVNEGSLS